MKKIFCFTLTLILCSPLFPLQAQQSQPSLEGFFSSLGNETAEESPVALSFSGLHPVGGAEEGEGLCYGFAAVEAVAEEKESMGGIVLDLDETELEPGESLQLQATVLPEEAGTPALNWTSSAPSVARVEDGRVEALAEGEAVITVTTAAGVYSDRCLVTVREGTSAPRPVRVTDVSLDLSEATLGIDESIRLKATVYPYHADNKRVSWSTSDEGVATVAKGKVTGVSEGTATIQVKTADGGFTDVCRVTVTAVPTGVENVSGGNRVYPTVVEHSLYVELEKPETVFVVHASGQICVARLCPVGISPISMQGYPAGIYFVRFGDETVKVVKK